MKILIFIFAIIGIIELILSLTIDWKSEEAGILAFGSGVTLIIVSLICIIIVSIEEKIKIEPIEVYRGNTTLQITYQDSTPIDSVVVYKNKS